MSGTWGRNGAAPTIALHGAYRHDNFGDMLLLGIYIRWIRETYPGCRVILPFLRHHLTGLVNADGRGLAELQRASALVYGGGGYFGEPNSGRTLWAMRNTWRHMPVGLMARMRGIPIAISGVGAGPLSSGLARRLFVRLFGWSGAVAVRDMESRDFMAQYGVDADRMVVTADAALSLDESSVTPEALAEARQTLGALPGSWRIGFNVAHSIRLRGMDPLLDDLRTFAADHPEAAFVFFLDEGAGRGESYHVTRMAREIERRVAAPAVVVPYRDPDQVLGVIKALDLVITTKLHVGIVACALGTSVLAFPAHQKTRRFYEQIGAADRCLPLHQLAPGDALAQLERFARGELGPAAVPPAVRAAALNNRTVLAGFLARALSVPELATR
jgi:polysaccharide pyruvyl transferase WcaK-like protein